MKYIVLIIGLLVVGCEKGGEITIGEPPKAKPVKELTAEEKKVVGTYEEKEDGETKRLKHQAKDSPRMVLLENGIVEGYRSGKKEEKEAKWMMLNGELHLIYEDGDIVVFSINKDESITGIATMNEDGKREEIPKEDQQFVPTFKKIK